MSPDRLAYFEECVRRHTNVTPSLAAELLEHVRAQAERIAKLAAFWSETEARSSEAHDVYQKEAHRRGDVRHPDAYADLSDATKEWDRVLVRWVAESVQTQLKVTP